MAPNLMSMHLHGRDAISQPPSPVSVASMRTLDQRKGWKDGPQCLFSYLRNSDFGGGKRKNHTHEEA